MFLTEAISQWGPYFIHLLNSFMTVFFTKLQAWIIISCKVRTLSEWEKSELNSPSKYECRFLNAKFNQNLLSRVGKEKCRTAIGRTGPHSVISVQRAHIYVRIILILAWPMHAKAFSFSWFRNLYHRYLSGLHSRGINPSQGHYLHSRTHIQGMQT
jgi:hypothetical protein